ncbi:MAG: exonuclease subunit SbcD, partial [Thermoplasmata archaeon]|nr:exonuclease subunit SbcD [Thermoplasmata archaeon]
MVKVLHTSDWHLGARLYEKPRHEESAFFLNWLRGVVRNDGVNLLLVAGDIYDSSLPPGEAVNLYYSFLRDLYRDNVERIKKGEMKVVIIGGNHDSPLRLEGPREFLKLGGIEVFGRWMADRGTLKPPEPVRIVVDGERVSVHPFPYIAPHEALGKAPRWNDEEREEFTKVLSEAMERSVEEGEEIRICLSHLWVEGLQGGGSE